MTDEALKWLIVALLATIALLPGWEQSLGVSAELALARNCGLDVLELKGASDV